MVEPSRKALVNVIEDAPAGILSAGAAIEEHISTGSHAGPS
jgi:hypothetical protein